MITQQFAHSPVYFVFLGGRIPTYGLHSLELASQWSGLPTHLIASEPARKVAHKAGAGFTCLEDFYDRGEFTEAARHLTSLHSFRGGLWLRSLERLFVLHQFANSSSLDAFFHAELDQLLFRVDLMQQSLIGSAKRGVFFPLQTKSEGIASLLFCNDLEAFATLLTLARGGGVFPNEMRLLGEWANLSRSRFIELPTIPFYKPFADEQGPTDFASLSPEELGGVVDAAQLGQWIGGEDPRNIPVTRIPRTRFISTPTGRRLTREELERVRFRFDTTTSQLSCQVEAWQPVNLYNLHLHSKVHGWVHRRGGLQEMLCASNRNISLSIPGTRKAQVLDRVAHVAHESIKNPDKIGHTLMRGIALGLSLRPSSYPYISGDSFRRACDFTFEGNDPRLLATAKRTGRVFFCESHHLEQFFARVVPLLESPITLVLSNSDFDPSQQLTGLLPAPQINAVFAQNLTRSIDNVYALPIGLENAWRYQHGIVSYFDTARRAKVQKFSKIMWSFSLHTNPSIRIEAANALLRNHLAIQYQPLPTKRYVSTVRKFQFIACPPGNGLDTHRVWEAMYLGAVPIVYHSQAMHDFQSRGLPVWPVSNYDELAYLSERDLQSVYSKLAPGFDSPWLWAGAWINEFGGELPHVRSTTS